MCFISRVITVIFIYCVSRLCCVTNVTPCTNLYKVGYLKNAAKKAKKLSLFWFVVVVYITTDITVQQISAIGADLSVESPQQHN